MWDYIKSFILTEGANATSIPAKASVVKGVSPLLHQGILHNTTQTQVIKEAVNSMLPVSVDRLKELIVGNVPNEEYYNRDTFFGSAGGDTGAYKDLDVMQALSRNLALTLTKVIGLALVVYTAKQIRDAFKDFRYGVPPVPAYDNRSYLRQGLSWMMNTTYNAVRHPLVGLGNITLNAAALIAAVSGTTIIASGIEKIRALKGLGHFMLEVPAAFFRPFFERVLTANLNPTSSVLEFIKKYPLYQNVEDISKIISGKNPTAPLFSASVDTTTRVAHNAYGFGKSVVYFAETAINAVVSAIGYSSTKVEDAMETCYDQGVGGCANTVYHTSLSTLSTLLQTGKNMVVGADNLFYNDVCKPLADKQTYAKEDAIRLMGYGTLVGLCAYEVYVAQRRRFNAATAAAEARARNAEALARDAEARLAATLAAATP